jgi:hypothetical protein
MNHLNILAAWEQRCAKSRSATVHNCPILTRGCVTVEEAVAKLRHAVEVRRNVSKRYEFYENGRYGKHTDQIVREADALEKELSAHRETGT